jgi:hypothetical protein
MMTRNQMISQRALWQLLHRDSEVRVGSFFPMGYLSAIGVEQTSRGHWA